MCSKELIYVRADQRRRIEAYAKEAHVPMAEIIERALEALEDLMLPPLEPEAPLLFHERPEQPSSQRLTLRRQIGTMNAPIHKVYLLLD
jgi:hypothetical protein